jgi:hypothetical protein
MPGATSAGRYCARVNEIVVAGRYNGPPDSGNGGYTCGLVAAATLGAGNSAEVTLRRPPPLDVPLRVDGNDVLDVRDGETLVATATAADLADVTPPAFPGYDAARAAEARYAGLRDHPFPTCFVCGPRRTDGLGLAPGPVGDRVVATTWTAREPAPEQVWAVLDCPGAWALTQTDEAPIVLGRLAVETYALPVAGQPHVVVGWRHAERAGRKHYAGTALYDAAGTLLAKGRAAWIETQRPAQSSGAT